MCVPHVYRKNNITRIKYSGAANSKESIESKKPPRPGIPTPPTSESFCEQDRLIVDSNKSPIMEKIDTKILVIITNASSKLNVLGYKRNIIYPAMIEPKMPPKKPAMLLFGLAFIKPLFPLPSKIPKNHASESHANTISKKEIMNIVDELGRRASWEKNVEKKPIYIMQNVEVQTLEIAFLKVSEVSGVNTS